MSRIMDLIRKVLSKHTREIKELKSEVAALKEWRDCMTRLIEQTDIEE